MGRKNQRNFLNSHKFTDSLIMNNATFYDYLDRFKKLSLSIFEWVNLPSSMDARFLEQCLYYDGQATLLHDSKLGKINTRCAGSGDINIYNLPTKFECYSHGYSSQRSLYTGLPKIKSDAMLKYMEQNECILVQNNWDRTPTAVSMELFALRLTEAERTADTNLKAQKTPVLLLCDDKQRLTLEQVYNQYNGNQPFIFGSKNLGSKVDINAIKTDAPYLLDKIMDYKKEIWNEALTFLGINNILVDKKERLITDEANSNNELINLNLQSFLAPRIEACRQYNEKFGLTGTDKEISVRVRSDLHNTIKTLQSSVSDLNEDIDNKIQMLKEGDSDVKIYKAT